MLKQRTLKNTIKTTGVGLHTGARVEIVLRRRRPTPASFSTASTSSARSRFPPMRCT
jgi:UDP-3-O-acyl-N-acetylglucosamine deacetylase